jgi:hypothetical protein
VIHASRRGHLLNVACTETFALIVTVQLVAVPEQAPPQPTNAFPAGGVAVSVTAVPAAGAIGAGRCGRHERRLDAHDGGAAVIPRLLADLVVLAHAGFVAFVVLGGMLVLRRPWILAAHLSAVAWAVLLELAGLTCPLTPLENWLRERAGETPYAGGFVDHWVLPVLYPDGLTRTAQVGLGAGALVVNLLVYGWVLRRRSGVSWFRLGGSR